MIKYILVFLCSLSVCAFFLWFGGMELKRGPLESFFTLLAIVLSLGAAFVAWESDDLNNDEGE